MVTFLPHLRYNSPRLNDLAIRSNEYLTSKRFLLTTARSVVCFLVLSRINLFYSSRRPSPNPRRLILLQTLLRSQKSQLLCNQVNPDSSGKIPGGTPALANWATPVGSGIHAPERGQLFYLQAVAASLASFRALLRTPFLCFQQLTASFHKTPGWGVPYFSAGFHFRPPMQPPVSSFQNLLP